jgi:hypothetical protein
MHQNIQAAKINVRLMGANPLPLPNELVVGFSIYLLVYCVPL